MKKVNRKVHSGMTFEELIEAVYSKPPYNDLSTTPINDLFYKLEDEFRREFKDKPLNANDILRVLDPFGHPFIGNEDIEEELATMMLEEKARIIENVIKEYQTTFEVTGNVDIFHGDIQDVIDSIEEDILSLERERERFYADDPTGREYDEYITETGRLEPEDLSLFVESLKSIKEKGYDGIYNRFKKDIEDNLLKNSEQIIRSIKEENMFPDDKSQEVGAVLYTISIDKPEVYKQLVGEKSRIGTINEIFEQLFKMEHREYFLPKAFEEYLLRNKPIKIDYFNDGNKYSSIEILWQSDSGRSESPYVALRGTDDRGESISRIVKDEWGSLPAGIIDKDIKREILASADDDQNYKYGRFLLDIARLNPEMTGDTLDKALRAALVFNGEDIDLCHLVSATYDFGKEKKEVIFDHLTGSYFYDIYCVDAKDVPDYYCLKDFDNYEKLVAKMAGDGMIYPLSVELKDGKTVISDELMRAAKEFADDVKAGRVDRIAGPEKVSATETVAETVEETPRFTLSELQAFGTTVTDSAQMPEIRNGKCCYSLDQTSFPKQHPAEYAKVRAYLKDDKLSKVPMKDLIEKAKAEVKAEKVRGMVMHSPETSQGKGKGMK